jgi:predicted MPP superfamily phosphohydrolase
MPKEKIFMNRLAKILPIISMLIAGIFTAVCLLVHPLWSDIHSFLGVPDLPVVQTLAVLGGLYAFYAYRALTTGMLTGDRRWLHSGILILVDAILLILMVILINELGYESVVIPRMAAVYLPIVFWVSVAVLLFWIGPFWKPFKEGRIRFAAILVLGLAAIIWISLPWRVELITRPVVFMQADGVTVNWGTNLPAANLLRYGDTPAMAEETIPQTHGLIDVGEGMQRVYLAGETQEMLYFYAFSAGVRKINPASAIKAGEAESETIQVNFPSPGEELFLAAFSDIHEQTQIYKQLASHIPWEQVDYALYLGDLVHHVDNAQQTAEAILGLPTGDLDLPRVFARGNHETRGAEARDLSNWLLPPGGQYYYTFEGGNAFFVVLDSGEDKPDSHVEYAELINFTEYHQEQAEWLSEVFESVEFQNADYQIVLVHIPPLEGYSMIFDEDFQTDAFDPVLDLLRESDDIDLVMSGHIHRGGIWLPEETGLPFPVTTCGGPLGIDTAAVTAHLKETGIQLDVINILGNTVESAWLPAK